MSEIFSLISQHLDPWWVVGALFLLLVLDRTSFVQRWLSSRQTREQAFVDDLVGEAKRQREYRDQDNKWHEGESSRLRAQLSERDDLIRSQIRGEARARHTIRCLMQHIAAQRYAMAKNNVPVTPFNQWATLMEFDQDLEQRFREILGEYSDEGGKK